MLRHATVSFSIVLLIGSVVGATEPRLTAETFEGLELRGIGPALMSGRIADIAVDPADPATWYVAVGSGGCGRRSTPAPPGSRCLTMSRRTRWAA
jgi:hypothetical protein